MIYRTYLFEKSDDPNREEPFLPRSKIFYTLRVSFLLHLVGNWIMLNGI